MRSPEFWDYFDRVARPKLTRREAGFSKIFAHLDRLDRPVTIVETGCVREEDSWEGDGQSTILFSRYAEFHPGSVVFSVDIDPAATALCRSLVGPQVRLYTGDSVAILKRLSDEADGSLEALDLLYLDSYDVDLHNPLPAATQALKELLAIGPLLSAKTLVVVDDSPVWVLGLPSAEGTVTAIEPPRPGGKGQLIAEYAGQIGARLCFAHYQCGWLGLGRRGSAPSPPLDEGRPHADGSGSRLAAQRHMTMTDLVSRMSDALPRADRAALAWRLLEAEAEEVTFRRDGTRWTAFPWDRMISGPLFVRGNFQGAEISAVLAWMMRHRRFAAPRDVIVDVGANIGTSTIPFAQDTGCRVISIEPVPEIFAVLCRNVADNGLQSRVTCTQSAVMRAAGGRVQMVLPAGNSGGGEICRADKEPSFAGSIPARGTVEVPATGLSAILDACRVAPEQVAFVWSDTQGCEAEVIDTGRSLWTAGVPLFAEFVPLLWPDRVQPLLTAARACFVGFIPAAQLTAAAAKPRSIAELEEFCDTIGQEGADLLLIPPGTGA